MNTRENPTRTKSEMTEDLSRLREREDIVLNVLHDLKGPLIAAGSILEHLAAGEFGTISTGAGQTILQLKASNEDILTRIHECLEVLRFEKSRANCTEIDVHILLRKCMNRFTEIADARSVQLEARFCEKSPRVLAETMDICRLFCNLLDNAIKFSPDSGTVLVATSIDKTYWIFTVQNRGAVLNENEIESVFKPFWQSESAKKHPYGTGLGLYLCKKIITAHNGFIECRSNLEKGTEFQVSIPLASS